MWDAYEAVTRLNTKPDTYRVASFIMCIVPADVRIYNSLPFADASDKKLSKVLELMVKQGVGDTNVTYESFLLERRCQEKGEPFDRYLTVIRDIYYIQMPICMETRQSRCCARQDRVSSQ